MNSLLVIVGPTAAGKSALAIELAEALAASDRPGEIISADSVQVYRGLDIGSAKPAAADRARVPHHAIDLFDPSEPSDAATWARAADRAIALVCARGGVPIVCGGAGLYVRALLHGLSAVPEVDPDVRRAVREALEAEGPEALHAELARVDAAAAARIAPRDRQRITRALEVFRQTGRPLSAWQAGHRFAPRRYEARVVGLWPDRAELDARIARRVDAMLARGWVGEVRRLLAAGLALDAPGLRSLGYREVLAHLVGELPESELASAITSSHRRYAKRQLTWLRGVTRREDNLEHHDPGEPGLLGVLAGIARTVVSGSVYPKNGPECG